MEIEISKRSIQVLEALRNVTLLEFLRDIAGLKGTELGCDIGLCGVYTVHPVQQARVEVSVPQSNDRWAEQKFGRS